MLPAKIKMTDQIIQTIKAARNEKRIPAAVLSRALKRDDSYISSMELKRLQTISSVDFIAILCVVFEIPEHEAVEKAKELAGIGKEFDSYPDYSLHEPVSNVEGKETYFVSEPASAGYLSNAGTDYAEPELISDLMDALTGLIKEFYMKDPKEAVYTLNSFIKTMRFDPAFTMGVMGIPFYILRTLSIDKRKEVIADLSDVVKNHASNANLDESRVDGSLGTKEP